MLPCGIDVRIAGRATGFTVEPSVARRVLQSDSVPASERNVGLDAQGPPDLPRRNTRTEALGGGAMRQL